MSTVTETPAAVYHRVMNTDWPPSREARWAIGWAAATLWDALQAGDDFEAAECAKALKKRLREYRHREAARQDAEALIAARNMAQMTGGVL